jgi:hypothetical protein
MQERRHRDHRYFKLQLNRLAPSSRQSIFAGKLIKGFVGTGMWLSVACSDNSNNRFESDEEGVYSVGL